jgi:alpha-L-rhamnosidase
MSPEAVQAQATPESTLRSGFVNPPAEARLRCYWWWLNGDTTEETITHDLTEMSRKGFGGVLLVDANGSGQNGNVAAPAGPMFGSPAWVKLYVHALKTAAALHLEVTLNITSGWNLGGPDVEPADASKVLTWSTHTVSDSGFDGQLPMPEIKNGFYRQIAVLAYPLAHGAGLPGHDGDARSPIRGLRLKTAAGETGMSMPNTQSLLEDIPATEGEQDTLASRVIDISSAVDASGHLHWSPPSPGAWELLRIGYTDSDARVSTSSAAWQGLAIDYLDRGAFDTYWDHTVAPLLDVSRPYLKTTLVSLATDSWELGGTNWTGRFGDEFRKRRGYDPLPYLPIVAGRIVGDRATSNRFLNDLRRTAGDLVTDHYDHFAERAKMYGLGIQCESGGPHGAPLDALETFRSSAVPQTEYWAKSNEHRTRDEDRYFTKEAASAADIYGKRFVAQEGMTSIGPQWSESLATDLKPSFDQALTEGMNRLVWHEFTSSPADTGLPGNEYFAGTHINPKVTWWPQSGAFFDYLNRSQFMLQQGHSVDDILYFYGDEVPNFVRLKKDDPAHVLPGYDYDVTDEDALLHTLKFDGGNISTPAGNRYRVLALPVGRRLSVAALERIATYVQQGGNLSGLPPVGPSGVIDAAAAQRFSQLTDALWGSCGDAPHSYGKGLVFCGADARALLQRLKVTHDFEETSGTLDYAHRADATADIYIVRNGGSEAVDTTAVFRVGGRAPELWNAVDGTMRTQKDFSMDGDRTRMPLHLDPYGSIFVVFAKHNAVESRAFAKEAAPARTQELPPSQWSITFQTGRGAPAGPQALAAFESWSSSAVPGIRYFSGTAVYRTEIDLEHHAGERTVLTLASLHEICTVRVNGKELGTIWAMPYRLDITDGLHGGRNTLELEVTNLWPNRIIGDAQPGATETFTHTNIRKYSADSTLLPSGLIGPVKIETIPTAR